ncbi:MAG: hypothetical protein QXV17_13990 [Candidatus Micrarchaeaceae archaeon]
MKGENNMKNRANEDAEIIKSKLIGLRLKFRFKDRILQDQFIGTITNIMRIRNKYIFYVIFDNSYDLGNGIWGFPLASLHKYFEVIK